MPETRRQSNKTSKDRRRIVVLAAFAVLLVGCLVAILVTEQRPEPDAVVPDVTGQNLSDADNKLAATGLRVETQDASGRGRTVVVYGNWQVVSQSIVAGEKVGDREQILLDVLKSEEVERSTPETPTPASGPAQPTPTSATTPQPSPAAPTPSPTTAAPVRFSESMVRAYGVTEENRGGRSNVRFVAGTNDIGQIESLTNQCIDYYLTKTRAAYCYGYGNLADFELKTPDWTPEADKTVFGGSRPCWITFGGQPPAGPESRMPVQVSEGYEYVSLLCPGSVRFPS